MLQKMGDPAQQTPSRPAIQDPMVKTQGHTGLHSGDKLFFCHIPKGHASPCPDTQHKRLFWQWNRRAPIQTECPVIGDGGDGGFRCIRVFTLITRQIQQSLVLVIQGDQIPLVGIFKNGYQNPFRDLHREADIDL